METINVKGLRPTQAITYCGRDCNGWRDIGLGNPFTVGKQGTRAECIAKYRVRLWQMIRDGHEIAGLISSLPEDAVLGCWCKPEACHCDVIKACWTWMKTQVAR